MDFNTICRLCMENLSPPHSTSVFSTRKTQLTTMTVADMVMSCASVNIMKDDKFPQNICNGCYKKARISYTFKTQCETVHARLTKIVECEMSGNDSIKNDDDIKLETFGSDLTKAGIGCSGSDFNDVNDFKFLKTFQLDYVDGNTLDASIDGEKIAIHETNEAESYPVPKSTIKTKRKIRTNQMNRLKDSDKFVKCPVCALEFPSSKELTLHTRATNHVTNKRKCNICLKFVCKEYIKYHMLTHSDEKSSICSYCGVGFKLPVNLKQHMKVHSGERPYACATCDKTFKRSSALREHEQTHTKALTFACALCDKKFYQKRLLRRHRVIKHEEPLIDVKTHVCKCGKVFKASRHLRQHERNIHGDKKKCQKCGKSYATDADFHAHLINHAQLKPFVCQTCNKEFLYPKPYQTHMRTHTGERPFACTQCDRRFSRVDHLKTHQQIQHEGVKNFECQTCHKRFSVKSNLTVHMRIHTGELPYACDVCPKRFYTSSKLKKHRATHFGGLMAVN